MDCTPAVYEHAAFLIGRTPWEVSRSADLTFEAHAAAYRTYGHAPVVVSIDIYNLEAEAYGARVARPRDTGIPAILDPLCRSLDEVRRLPPFDPASAGRIPLVLEAAGRLSHQFPDADVRLPLAGPMSIASNLLGIEPLLLEIVSDPEAAADALMHLVQGQVRLARAVVDAGLDVAFFESAAAPPLLSPRMFRQVELPALKAIMEGTAELVGHPVPCVIGGNTEPILPALLETGTGYLINPIETDQEAFMRGVRDRTDVRIRINASPRIVAQGSREELRAEVERIAALAGGRPNTCLGTSALPYETPPENVLYIQELCRQL
ncbi:MAG: uroporphyrinogen decarboxylase family protein [Thermoguttaceae bacterium]